MVVMVDKIKDRIALDKALADTSTRIHVHRRQSEATPEEAFFPKYLTGRQLLPLEVKCIGERFEIMMPSCGM